MPIFKTQNLKPGGTLAQEIQNHSGRILLPKGTVLTEKHILNLKAWGIAEADIESEDMQTDPAAVKIDPQKQARAKKEAETLFCLSNRDHPAIIELMRLSGINRLKKMPGMGHVNVK